MEKTIYDESGVAVGATSTERLSLNGYVFARDKGMSTIVIRNPKGEVVGNFNGSEWWQFVEAAMTPAARSGAVDAFHPTDTGNNLAVGHTTIGFLSAQLSEARAEIEKLRIQCVDLESALRGMFEGHPQRFSVAHALLERLATVQGGQGNG